MPLTIKASCTTCGAVDLIKPQVSLHVYDPEVAGSAYYEFTCPFCNLLNQKEASDEQRRLLVIADVQIHVHPVPAEVLEPHSGEPINHDDMIDFHLAIAKEAFLTQLLDPDV